MTWLIICLAFFLGHCRQTPRQQQSVAQPPPETAREPLSDFPVREIAGNFFDPWQYYGEKDIFFMDNQDTTAILAKLFPGQLIESDSDDPTRQVGWICPDCPKTLLDNDLLYEEPDEKITFPFSGFNYTQLIGDWPVPPNKRVMEFNICVDREGDVILLKAIRVARSAAESEAMQYAQYTIPEKVRFGRSEKDFRFGKVTIHLLFE